MVYCCFVDLADRTIVHVAVGQLQTPHACIGVDLCQLVLLSSRAMLAYCLLVDFVDRTTGCLDSIGMLHVWWSHLY